MEMALNEKIRSEMEIKYLNGDIGGGNTSNLFGFIRKQENNRADSDETESNKGEVADSFS